MFHKILTVFLLLSTVTVNVNGQYAYAVDVLGSLTTSQFSCIKSSGYSAVFTQIYSASNGGTVDTNGCQSVINAYQVGLGTEVYINPSPQSSKQSYMQFDEAYQQLKNANINVRTIWLKVTNPVLWYQNPSNNINFIQGMITRARSYGVTLGIFTSWYDWYQITASTTTFQQYNLPLWYWNTLGFGPSAEGSANFNDFRTFGGWSSPMAKEYALNESCCSAIISKVAYQTSSSFSKLLVKNVKYPLAGSAIF
ncbi:Glycoside hydrolase, superfamily domain-containing protein [Strongyloides ratti]|uniref:Glycoside hydrolase, superfamily domain-containing protein n=1 Tax=Strongyloides ratti TaxID=34506 RepID=A0A090LDE7_STRRB|nr:Glycoside hydrolase, superfamily domain-containing protein [Strongyloides ratti]CEF67772.1 Glycoside hydrolase, superfamily domain-containing protein [Strongyloides ratti]